MQDIIAQIFSYVWGIWRYRWAGLVLAWLLAIAGWTYVWVMPESFKATARVQVDTGSILQPLLRGLAIQPNVAQRVEMMSRTLLNRPNLEKLIRMSDLDLTVKTGLQEERLLEQVRESISLEGDARNRSLYSVSFKHEDRETAKRVVQSLVTIFIETTLGEKRRDSSGAQVFLEQQITDYQKRMAAAEARLAEFKQRHVGLLPGEAGGYYQRLNQAKSVLNQAELELREMANRRDELKRQLEGEDPAEFSSTFGSSESLSPLDRRIQMLQQQLDELSLDYTEAHPRVLQIRDKITDLEAEKQAAYQSVSEGDTPSYSGMGSNPVYQNIRTLLTETEARAAELTVRVAEFENRVKTLEETVDSIPKIEVELQQLDRDYSAIAKQHAALLSRREAALLSEQVEKNADDVKFRIIDPPFVPLNPTEPNKLLLNTGVLILALGAGAGLSFLISLLKPVFMDRRTLSQNLGLPVLGIVSLIPSPEQAKASMRRGLIFASMTVCLVIVFAGVSIGQSVL